MEGFVLEMPPLEEELKVVIIITSANTIIGSDSSHFLAQIYFVILLFRQRHFILCSYFIL